MTDKPLPKIIQASQLQSVEDCKEVLLAWLAGEIPGSIGNEFKMEGGKKALNRKVFKFNTDKRTTIKFILMADEDAKCSPQQLSTEKGFYTSVEIYTRNFKLSEKSDKYKDGVEINTYNYLPIDLLAKEIYTTVKGI